MKAIRVHAFGEPSVLQLQDVSDPTPGDGQVVVRLRAIGVNPVETYIRRGIYGPKTFPYTPGTDGAGEIEALGPGVTEHRVGDRVYVFGAVTGTYAEKVVCEAIQVRPLPKDVSFEQGAAIGVPYATAYRALHFRGNARPGETVLVHGGTGGVGIAAVQMARAAGLKVVATGGTAEGRKLAEAEGAHHTLDHSSEGYLDDLMNLTGGRGVDLVLEMLANVNLAKDLTVIARNGRVVVVGSRGKIEIEPRQTMSRDADIRGMTLMNADVPELKSIHAAIGAGLANHSLRPVIGASIPLSEAARAHDEVMKPSGARGKIILLPGLTNLRSD